MQQIEKAATRGHVMVVDDDDLFRESVSTNLADAGYLIESFPAARKRSTISAARPPPNLSCWIGRCRESAASR